MRSSDDLRFSPWDLTVAAAVLLLSLVCWLPLRTQAAEGDLTAVLTADGAELDRVSLSALAEPQERTYTVNGMTLTVRFSADGVEVIDSTCPTLDCVHTGLISGPGKSIVCLPARLAIRLTGDGGVDAVVG